MEHGRFTLNTQPRQYFRNPVCDAFVKKGLIQDTLLHNGDQTDLRAHYGDSASALIIALLSDVGYEKVLLNLLERNVLTESSIRSIDRLAKEHAANFRKEESLSDKYAGVWSYLADSGRLTESTFPEIFVYGAPELQQLTTAHFALLNSTGLLAERWTAHSGPYTQIRDRQFYTQFLAYRIRPGNRGFEYPANVHPLLVWAAAVENMDALSEELHLLTKNGIIDKSLPFSQQFQQAMHWAVGASSACSELLRQPSIEQKVRESNALRLHEYQSKFMNLPMPDGDLRWKLSYYVRWDPRQEYTDTLVALCDLFACDFFVSSGRNKVFEDVNILPRNRAYVAGLPPVETLAASRNPPFEVLSLWGDEFRKHRGNTMVMTTHGTNEQYRFVGVPPILGTAVIADSEKRRAHLHSDEPETPFTPLDRLHDTHDPLATFSDDIVARDALLRAQMLNAGTSLVTLLDSMIRALMKSEELHLRILEPK